MRYPWSSHWVLSIEYQPHKAFIVNLLAASLGWASGISVDNLNTHTIGSLYEAFPPAKTRELAQRLEIHYTPIHGSRLNIAETELSVLSRQCFDQRIESIERLESECPAWYVERNGLKKGVDWQFTSLDERIKLKRLYPQVQ